MPSIPDPSSAPLPDGTMRGALAGIRVVEFAQNVAIPACGRVLAAMGADVVKVEPPGGDAARTMAPFRGLREGRTYAVANPGKRSVVLDLADPASHAARDALLRSADVVLCAFKGPDLTRYGLTYDHVRAVNPEVVYLEHRALGSLGPDAEEGGYDVLVQGLSGLSFVTSRSENDRPVSVRPAYSDMSTSLASTTAVLGALYHRLRTGQGQRVRTSLLGTAHFLAMPTNGRFDAHDTELLQEFSEDLTLLRQSGSGFDEQRALYESRVLPAGGVFDFCFRHYVTADSLISIGCLSPALMDRFYGETGLADHRRPGLEYRGREWQALVQTAEELLKTDTTANWVARLRGAGVPCAPYNTPMEAVNDPGALANGFVEDIDHPVLGRYRTTAAPLSMDQTPVRTNGPSPGLGAHTDEILAELGFDGSERAALFEAGVTRPR